MLSVRSLAYSKPRPHLAITSAVTPYGAKLAGRSDLRMLCVVAGYNWELACAEAAAQGRVMDRASYRIMAPFHIAETREKAIENVRQVKEMAALLVFSQPGGRCRDRHAEHRGDQPGRARRGAWRSQSMHWMRARREAFSAKPKTAGSVVEQHAEQAQKPRNSVDGDQTKAVPRAALGLGGLGEDSYMPPRDFETAPQGPGFVVRKRTWLSSTVPESPPPLRQ